MKKISLPPDSIVIVDKAHTAKDLLEDIVMSRAPWRSGEGPKHADIMFTAIDKIEVTSGVMLLPDKTYGFLLEQIALDPNTNITPRSANRLYLKLARAVNDATEHEEKA
jgi:hypothetical protein